MKLSKTLITILLSITIGGGILLMQRPVTKLLTESRPTMDLEIAKIWDLPKELNEVSGIAWLHGNTFACVQDEDGSIFIYDLDADKIISRIKFAGPGDYEAIAVKGDDAFVMRSDGRLFEIKGFLGDKIEVAEFETPFSSKNNMESLTFDAKNQRLLTVPKDRGLTDEAFKGIYQISLDTKQMDRTPIMKIDMENDQFSTFKSKKIEKTFNPSEIAVHPKTDAFYVLEGKNPKFMVLDREGDVLSIHPLNKTIFPQPEGMSFTEDGRLFISNEAAKTGNATIMEIRLK